jgi:peptidoglycan/LPS O-acetylase OafA/YrhL
VFKTYPGWNFGIVHVIVSLVAAVIGYHFIDKPLLRFGEISRPTSVMAKLESQT